MLIRSILARAAHRRGIQGLAQLTMDSSRPGEKRKAGRDSRITQYLTRAISPPRKRPRPAAPHTSAGNGLEHVKGALASFRVTKSPWQLTRIQDLPEELNRDAVSLSDLLGSPLIAECWQFNYLHNIPFVMDAFDEKARDLVKLHVVHGFWKGEDPNRAVLKREASWYKNVELHCAPMPEAFGTHHSKMMVLFRRDDTAQIIIHTANMIPKDWTNMTNAVWRSPLLPKARTSGTSGLHAQSAQDSVPFQDVPTGSGERFKVDLLKYLQRYDARQPVCKSLADKLFGYDFSGIRAALIASVPGRHDMRDLSETSWGWAGLRRALGDVPVEDGGSDVVVQVSSIATLGPRDDWLQKTLFNALSTSENKDGKRPNFKVVFPTADEIRRSLDGYASGGSIHTKIQSQQQASQLQYLRPIFHHWANDSEGGMKLPKGIGRIDGGRDRAAPHIKTYIRFNERNTIDWAMLTSANLSKQAWGETVRQGVGDVRIASWEIGVLVWPGLFYPGGGGVMVGSHRTDTPDLPTTTTITPTTAAEGKEYGEERGAVGIRIPYSVPLQRYGHDEVPWVTTMTHTEPDCKGLTWD